jgi:hypothetical protein
MILRTINALEGALTKEKKPAISVTRYMQQGFGRGI